MHFLYGTSQDGVFNIRILNDSGEPIVEAPREAICRAIAESTPIALRTELGALVTRETILSQIAFNMEDIKNLVLAFSEVKASRDAIYNFVYKYRISFLSDESDIEYLVHHCPARESDWERCRASLIATNQTDDINPGMAVPEVFAQHVENEYVSTMLEAMRLPFTDLDYPRYAHFFSTAPAHGSAAPREGNTSEKQESRNLGLVRGG